MWIFHYFLIPIKLTQQPFNKRFWGLNLGPQSKYSRVELYSQLWKSTFKILSFVQVTFKT